LAVSGALLESQTKKGFSIFGKNSVVFNASNKCPIENAAVSNRKVCAAASLHKSLFAPFVENWGPFGGINVNRDGAPQIKRRRKADIFASEDNLPLIKVYWLPSSERHDARPLLVSRNRIGVSSSLGGATGFAESVKYQAQTQNADRHSDNRGNAHSARPDSHGALGVEIITALLCLAGFLLNLLHAFRERRLKDGTFELYAFASGTCLLLFIPIGGELILGLF